jgi:predicted glycoside hydrolase/deacetylase ChbG (UPF0249 family)
MCHPASDLSTLSRLRDSGIQLGVHLVFVEERPLRADRALMPLLDAAGRFPRNYKRLFAAILQHPTALAALVREGEAQVERYLDLKLPLQLFTSHQHVHLFPPLWHALGALIERSSTALPRMAAWQWASPSPQTVLGAASTVAGWLRPLKQWESLRPVGLNFSGRLTEARLMELLDRDVPHQATRGGVPEVVVHPGLTTRRLTNLYGHWNFRWEEEFMLLQSASVRESLAARGLSLVGQS